MNNNLHRSSERSGFSLVEVTLAIGIVGMAILSLVGILGSTFQQVDDIMQTNRALAGVTRLVGALDNPRSIIYMDDSAATTNTKYIHQAKPELDPTPTTMPASNFEIAYRFLSKANNTKNAVWLYVYERKVLSGTDEVSASAGSTPTYNINGNPSVMEVAFSSSGNFTPVQAAARNVVGVPMRVRVSLSKLLIGQRFAVDATNLEPTSATWTGSETLPDVYLYPLAYLPLVVEFFPHDYADSTIFKAREETPILVQNIVISR
jgi:type II secretory pathway pseudopilin PulG